MKLSTQASQQFIIPQIPNDVPVYRIKEGKLWCDDEMHEEGTIIAFEEEPNLEMEPLNALANEKYRTFLKKLDNLGRQAAHKAGKAYTNLADAFSTACEIAAQEGGRKGRAQALNAPKAKVPILANKKKTGPRKATKIQLGETQGVAIKALGQTDALEGRNAVNQAIGGM